MMKKPRINPENPYVRVVRCRPKAKYLVVSFASGETQHAICRDYDEMLEVGTLMRVIGRTTFQELIVERVEKDAGGKQLKMFRA